MYSEAESSLIASCLKGNRTAQHTMYKRYCDAMYNVCYRILGSEPEAEDALQESFVDVFRRLDSFRGESSLGAWIKRIVINHSLNALKRRKISFEPMDDQFRETVTDTTEEEHDTEYDVKRVKEAIMKLPDGYRQVLTLYLIEGYDHGEIANILGIQETGSKSQYSRAKARLRELLNQSPRS
ncbi:MAG TPA: sigma-70 family RNA polymerase sigma factor [Saprospiraceae bacterium]|nr:sigma-70 family RNA polymerase sigma factor [Saprospiraceae bacterium]